MACCFFTQCLTSIMSPCMTIRNTLPLSVKFMKKFRSIIFRMPLFSSCATQRFYPQIMHWFLKLTVLAAILFGSGCSDRNVFGPSNRIDENNLNDLLEEGHRLMTKGEFQAAEKWFARADSVAEGTSSDARYLHAKATMLASGIPLVRLIEDLTVKFKQLGPLSLYTPVPPKMEDDRFKTLIYQTNITIARDLAPIIQKPTRAFGVIQPQDVRLDYALANAVRGVLRFRDFNGDGVIDDRDLCMDIERIAGAVQPFQIGRDGVPGLKDIITDLAMAHRFNQLIVEGAGDLANNVKGILEDTYEVLLEVDSGALISSPEVDQLRQNVKDLSRSTQAYLVKLQPETLNLPGQGDNDGDWQQWRDDLNGNGLPDVDFDGPLSDGNGDGLFEFDPEPSVDEELINGLDDDGDGLIDEDSHFIEGLDFPTTALRVDSNKR